MVGVPGRTESSRVGREGREGAIAEAIAAGMGRMTGEAVLEVDERGRTMKGRSSAAGTAAGVASGCRLGRAHRHRRRKSEER
jgi:hypothetical protein